MNLFNKKGYELLDTQNYYVSTTTEKEMFIDKLLYMIIILTNKVQTKMNKTFQFIGK